MFSAGSLLPPTDLQRQGTSLRDGRCQSGASVTRALCECDTVASGPEETFRACSAARSVVFDVVPMRQPRAVLAPMGNDLGDSLIVDLSDDRSGRCVDDLGDVQLVHVRFAAADHVIRYPRYIL